MFAKVFITLALVGVFCGTLNAQPVSADQKDCPLVCPLLYAPICGTDGENFLEFSNPCELKARNCQMERAITKPMVATELDRCRTELVDNMDSLLVKLGNLNIYKPECLVPCPRSYEPVCISNGKYRTLISNTCYMESINCALVYKNPFKILRNNSC